MPRTIRLTVSLLFCIMLIASSTIAEDFKRVKPEKVGLSSERLDRIGNLMQRTIDERRIAGTVSMVARHGKIAYLESHGMQDIEKGIPMRDDAIFRIYSMTKPITSLAVMMLYEEGHFLLTDPISKYIPEFKEMTILKKTESGEIYTVPAEKQITIFHLLTHSAGLGYEGTRDIGPLYKDAGLIYGDLLKSSQTIEDVTKTLAALPLLFEPGEDFQYSISISVLGYLVEVVSGLPLDDIFQNRIFDPLGMVDTHFYLPDDKVSRLSSAYTWDKEKGLEFFLNDQFYNGPKTLFMGGGGLCSTIQDYARFCQMMLNGGELYGFRLLSPKTVEFMMSVRRKETRPGTPQMSFGIGGSILGVEAPSKELESVGKYGWGGAFLTKFFIDPVEDLFAVFMVQQYGDNADKLQGKFEVAVYQSIVELNQQ